MLDSDLSLRGIKSSTLRGEITAVACDTTCLWVLSRQEWNVHDERTEGEGGDSVGP